MNDPTQFEGSQCTSSHMFLFRNWNQQWDQKWLTFVNAVSVVAQYFESIQNEPGVFFDEK